MNDTGTVTTNIVEYLLVFEYLPKYRRIQGIILMP